MSEVTATPRKSMTPKRRAEAFLASNGCCAKCAAKLTGAYEVDHRVSLWMGGADELHNLECLCVPCHANKTHGHDAPARAKTKRLIARANGTRRERKPIQSKGFDRTKTRGFDGKVRDRHSGEK